MRVRGKEIRPNWRNIGKVGLVATVFLVIVGTGHVVRYFTNPQLGPIYGSMPAIYRLVLLGLGGWIFVFFLVMLAIISFAGVLFVLDIDNVDGNSE